MTHSPELTVAFVDKAKGVLVGLHRLIAETWDAARAESSQEDLGALADYAGNLQYEDVRSAVLDLYAYLGVFAEDGREPKPAQRQELARLAEHVQTAVMVLAPAAQVSGGASVYLLAPGMADSPALAAALRQESLQLRAFEDGDDFATALRQHAPQLILVQAGLVGAVTELLDSLSGSAFDATRIPMVAIADGDPEGRLQSLVMGADLWVENLDDPALATQLRELLATQSSTPYRVLVVDDDRQMCTYCESILGRAGMQVKSCTRAADVVTAVRDFHPDLVLMDLYLPGSDGLTLTAQLRQQADALVLPIVFLSGEQNEEARFRAIQAGGDDYLTKPIRPRHLVAAVRSRIKRVRALSRQLTRQPGDAQGHMRRGAFLDHLRKLLKEPPTNPVALVVANVDQADAIQERLSLSSCHELEQAVAWRLAHHFAANDRYGLIREFGFGIVVERPQRSELLGFASEICRHVSQLPFKIDGKDQSLTVSVGLALMRAGEADVDAWIGAAFAAARAAARGGGNRVEGLVSDVAHGVSPERVLRIRELLRQLSDRRVLAIDYQPLIPLRGSESGRYILQVRLRDSGEAFGGIERHEFVPIAREAGIQQAIDRDIVQRAIAALNDQRTRNRVNDLVVPLDFASTGAEQIAWIAAEWAKTRTPDRRLTIEFDAAQLLENTQAARTLARLQAQGLRIGAALASAVRLPQLANLPLHTVRIGAPDLLALKAEVADPMVEQWTRGGRAIVVDALQDLTPLARLWNLGIDYLCGDTVASAGPRPDFEFSEINLG
ncbi:MAG: response regulator [Xanthomonadales bacterium]|nr:response regulator [Xanthomonadales bacterium]